MTPPALPRPVAAVLATVVAAAGLLVAGPAPAQAHAQLVGTAPASGARLDTAPTEVVLTFDEPPISLGAQVRVTGPGGTVSTGEPTITGSSVHQALQAGLPAGVYQVVWRVTSDDGHPVSDTFRFTVAGAGAPSGPATTTATSPAPVPTATPLVTSPGTSTGSQSLQNSGVSAPLLWGIIAVVLLVIAAVAAAVRTRRSNQEKS